MKMKIVADSSANLLALPDIDFGVVPLHIIVGENDYIDDDKIDLTAMQENLSSYKGKTSTSSPSPHEWENAFGDADVVFCITITSSLSGTYNSAVIAKDIYEHNHTGRKVYVLDSLYTFCKLLRIRCGRTLHKCKGYRLNVKRTDYESSRHFPLYNNLDGKYYTCNKTRGI